MSLRVSFVEPHLEVFGGIRRVMELSNRLVDLDVATTIYHPSGKPCSWMEQRAEVKPSSTALEDEHDVVIYNDPNPFDFHLVRRMTARLKVFYVLELYETRLLTGFHPSLFRPRHQATRYMKRSLRSQHLKLANASWLVEWLRRNMNIEAELLLGGVNRQHFHPVDVPRESGCFRILCSGDPRPRKGTAMIREAVDRVRRDHPEVELATYHGKGTAQQEMGRVYSGADLFIEASRQAGWNNPVAEAMACGVPVVCTDIGGVRDFAEHEATALLVPSDDVESMASAIARMVGDAVLRERLGLAALERIGHFHWDASAARLRDLLVRHLDGSDSIAAEAAGGRRV